MLYITNSCKFFLYPLLFGFLQTGLAQNTTSTSEEDHKPKHKHVVNLLLGHAHLSQGIQNGDTKWLALPSWMLSYNYMVSNEWAIGFHSDIIIENFQVEANARSAGDREILERSYPISFLAAGTYKPLPHLGILAGGGFEYAREETFGLIRLGLEPAYRISRRLEVVINLSYDFKINAYNNWNLGFGIAHVF